MKKTLEHSIIFYLKYAIDVEAVLSHTSESYTSDAKLLGALSPNWDNLPLRDSERIIHAALKAISLSIRRNAGLRLQRAAASVGR